MWIRCIKCLLQPRYELSLFHTHTHTYPLAVATLEDGGSVVVPGVTGSAWAETTNRCNQLSWDSSHCCHAHYSWTNTYIKQPGATGPGTTLGYTHTGSHILNINATHTQLHALFVVTHIAFQRIRPIDRWAWPPQNSPIISKPGADLHISDWAPSPSCHSSGEESRLRCVFYILMLRAPHHNITACESMWDRPAADLLPSPPAGVSGLFEVMWVSPWMNGCTQIQI